MSGFNFLVCALVMGVEEPLFTRGSLFSFLYSLLEGFRGFPRSAWVQAA